MARFGVELLRGLLLYAVLVVVGEIIHAFGVLSVALRLWGVRVGAFWRHVADAPLLAFSTASSNATLPVSLEVAERNLGVIFDVSAPGNNIVSADPVLDLTTTVVRRLQGGGQ